MHAIQVKHPYSLLSLNKILLLLPIELSIFFSYL